MLAAVSLCGLAATIAALVRDGRNRPPLLPRGPARGQRIAPGPGHARADPGPGSRGSPLAPSPSARPAAIPQILGPLPAFRNTLLARSHSAARRYVPLALVAATEALCGSAAAGALSRHLADLLRGRTRAFQAAFALLLGGTFFLYTQLFFPLVPGNPRVGEWAVPATATLTLAAAAAFAATCRSDPGRVRPDEGSAPGPREGPPKFCRACGVAVAGFDHHCVWVNNCVGRGNGLLFLSFVALHAALALWGSWLGYQAVMGHAERHGLLARHGALGVWALVSRRSPLRPGLVLFTGGVGASLAAFAAAMGFERLVLGTTSYERREAARAKEGAPGAAADGRGGSGPAATGSGSPVSPGEAPPPGASRCACACCARPGGGRRCCCCEGSEGGQCACCCCGGARNARGRG